jgi:DNA-binding CsgD family transcriptional regulator
MTSRSGGLLGRCDELAALGADGPGRTLVVLTGERGSGRTAMLGHTGATARAAGRAVLHVDLGGSRAEWDDYGAASLLDAVVAQLEQLGAAPDLIRGTSALRQRCSARSYRTAEGRAGIHGRMQELLMRLGRGALVLLDDVDLLPNPETLAMAARAAGHRVIAATGPGAALADVADTLVRAEPIAAGDVEHLLRRVLHARPDPMLVETVGRALGPLRGNPAHILAMLGELRRTDRLVTVARHACLREPQRTPTLPFDVPAMIPVGEPGGIADNLLLVVGGPARVRIDDVPLLAVASGRTAQEIGRVVDRLVREETLAEHDGELVVPCPAVGAAVRERASAGRIRALHAAVALAATDPLHDELARLGRSVLADHVAAAGEALAPDPAWGPLLRGQARNEEHRRPERAGRFLLASDRHCAGGQDRARTTERTVRVLLRAGDHVAVACLVAAVVDAGGHEPATPGGVDPELLAAAAAVAALTLRVPVPGAVHTALAGADPAVCPLVAAQRWADGASLTAQELLRALAVLTTADPAGCHRSSAALLTADAALAARDIVGALRWLLGPAYTMPSDGSLALLQRVFRAYRGGRWDEASAAARAMFADHGSGDQDAALRERAALFAADMANLQGDERAVKAWYEYLPDRTTGSLNPILYAYVQAAVLWVAGDGEGALAQGWRAWAAFDPGAFVLVRRALLTRLCGIAAMDRRRQWYPRLLEAADEWHRVAEGAEAIEATETRDLVRGVLGGTAADRAALERTVERARERGHRIDLGWVLLGAAARDPSAGWSEARAIAEDLHTPVPRARLRRYMSEHGMRSPRSRSRPAALTEIQLRILGLLEQGMTNRQIARDVRMSEKSVESHLTRLFVRFACRTRHELVTARLTARRDVPSAGAPAPRGRGGGS